MVNPIRTCVAFKSFCMKNKTKNKTRNVLKNGRWIWTQNISTKMYNLYSVSSINSQISKLMFVLRSSNCVFLVSTVHAFQIYQRHHCVDPNVLTTISLASGNQFFLLLQLCLQKSFSICTVLFSAWLNGTTYIPSDCVTLAYTDRWQKQKEVGFRVNVYICTPCVTHV